MLKNIKCGIYNLGSGKNIDVTKLLQYLCNKHNIKHTIVKAPEGVSTGYIATDNLIKCNDNFLLEEEWLKYLM